MKTEYPLIATKSELNELSDDVSLINQAVTEAQSDITDLQSNEYYLRYLDYTSLPYGAMNSGANYSQGKIFKFSKAISWTNIFFNTTVQNDLIFSHIVPISITRGKVQSINLSNAAVAASIVRVYFLVRDPDVMVTWE